MDCCNKKSTITTLNTTKSKVGYAARTVQKEQRKQWHVHAVDVDLKMCSAKAANFHAYTLGATTQSDICFGAANNFTNASDAHYTFVGEPKLKAQGDVLSARFRLRSDKGDAADAKQAAEKVLAKWMKNNGDILSGCVEVETAKKEKVTTYDVWAGLDNYTCPH